MRLARLIAIMVFAAPNMLCAQGPPFVQECVVLQGQKGVDAIALSPDGSLLAAGHYTNDVVVWDVQNQKVKTVLKDVTDGILSLSFSKDGTTLHAVGGVPGRGSLALMAWDVASEKFARTFLSGSMAWAYSPDHKVALSLAKESKHKIPYLWDLENGKGRPLPEHDHVIHALFISPDGKKIVTIASGPKPIRVFNLKDGKPIHEFTLKGQFEMDQTVSISADGKRMAAIGFPGHYAMQLLDLEKGIKLGAAIVDAYIPIALLPNGKHVIAHGGREPAILNVWDVESRKKVLTLRATFGAGKLAVSADGRFVAASGSGGRISIWKLPKLEP